MLELDSGDKDIFLNVISKYPLTFYAFGSRVTKSCKKFSDIDLYIDECISDIDLFYLKEEFEDSNLSVKVDIKRKKDMDSEFFSLIKTSILVRKNISNDSP